MQVLSEQDAAMYSKLVRLAGGDTDIVMRVLAPSRGTVSLSTVIQEIEELRDSRQGSGGPGGAAQRRTIAG